MHLYFVRHGESFVNLKEWRGGNRDEGLTPLEHVLGRHHLPPSIARTWPGIQPAYSDAKNSTPHAMSSGVPSLLRAMLSTRVC